MAEKTIVALFDSFEAATAAVNDILQAGTAPERISLLANDTEGRHPPTLMSNPAFAREDVVEEESEQSHTAVGAEVGLGLGGVLGLLAGAGAIAIPGIGPLIAAGTWATIAAGAAAGGGVGGIIGALTEHGIIDKDAHLYAEGLRRGGTLVTVKVPEDQIEAIAKLFKTHGAIDIEKRSAAWVAEGWVSFDPNANPLTPAERAALASGANDTVEHHHHVRHYFHPGSAVPFHGGAANVTTHYGEDETGT